MSLDFYEDAVENLEKCGGDYALVTFFGTRTGELASIRFDVNICPDPDAIELAVQELRDLADSIEKSQEI